MPITFSQDLFFYSEYNVTDKECDHPSHPNMRLSHSAPNAAGQVLRGQGLAQRLRLGSEASGCFQFKLVRPQTFMTGDGWPRSGVGVHSDRTRPGPEPVLQVTVACHWQARACAARPQPSRRVLQSGTSVPDEIICR